MTPICCKTQVRNRPGASTRGNNEVPGLQTACTTGFQSDRNGGHTGAFEQLRRTLDDLDLVFLHQKRNAGIELCGYTP